MGRQIERLGESDEYVEAFKDALLKIENEISEGQRIMLLSHYAASNMRLSVKKLAELAGYDGDRSGSMHYGKLARKISDAKGIEPPYEDQISAIAEWTNEKDERGHGQWVLYDELAQALEELGWVESSIQNNAIEDAGKEDVMNGGWSQEELRASVEAYLEMLHSEHDGKPFTKSDTTKLCQRNSIEQQKHSNTECKISPTCYRLWAAHGLLV